MISFRPTTKKIDPRKNLDPGKNILTHTKNIDPRKKIDPRKNIFDPRNPHKDYDPRKKYLDPRNSRNPRKIWSTQPMHPRNPRYHATHAI